jgi:hypothetical protein
MLRPSRAEQWSWREGEEEKVERGRQADGLARGRFGEFLDSAPVCACCFLRERERMSGWDLPLWASIIVIILYGTYRRST